MISFGRSLLNHMPICCDRIYLHQGVLTFEFKRRRLRHLVKVLSCCLNFCRQLWNRSPVSRGQFVLAVKFLSVLAHELQKLQGGVLSYYLSFYRLLFSHMSMQHVPLTQLEHLPSVLAHERQYLQEGDLSYFLSSYRLLWNHSLGQHGHSSPLLLLATSLVAEISICTRTHYVHHSWDCQSSSDFEALTHNDKVQSTHSFLLNT